MSTSIPHIPKQPKAKEQHRTKIYFAYTQIYFMLHMPYNLELDLLPLLLKYILTTNYQILDCAGMLYLSETTTFQKKSKQRSPDCSYQNLPIFSSFSFTFLDQKGKFISKQERFLIFIIFALKKYMWQIC